MTFTPISQGVQHWDVPLNAALQDLQDQETNHAFGVDSHGDRAYAATHVAGTTVSGTAANGRILGATGATTTSWADTFGTGPWVFNVRAYGALGDGKCVTDGAITAASAVLTSATAAFTAGDVGKVIQIKGAAATGVTSLVTTIQAFTNATTVTLATPASTTVASGGQVLWGTDDTASIQAAINAATTWARANSGAATVFFPGCPGFYCVGGALVTGGATKGNGQLTLPVIPVAEKKVHLTVLGTSGGSVQHWLQQVPMLTGAVVSFGVFTSIAGQSASITANGNPCLLSGPLQPGGYGSSALLYSNMQVTLRDLNLLTTHSAYGLTYSAADFSGLACASLERVSYGTAATVVNSDYATPAQFSTGLSMGILMPANGGNDNCYVDNLVCHGGYTWGLVATEHTVINRAVLLYCWSALGVTGSYNTSVGASHAFYANQLSMESCSNIIYVFGQGAAGLGPFLDFNQIDTEIGAPTIQDNGGGAGITALLGTIRLVGLYTSANISVGGFPTGLKIIDGQGQLARTVSATASVRVTDETVLGNTTAGGFTLTLISALRTPNKIAVRNIGSANTLTLACVGGQTINGSATLALTTGQIARLVSDGANWFTV
jgi:hypothetical protein